MTNIDLMIFDFDGTLINSGEDLAAAVNYTLGMLGHPVLEKETIIGYIGDGVKKLIERSLGNAWPDTFEEALKIFTSYYTEHMLDMTGLYPGVWEVLDHFREKKKIIVTNKLQDLTVRIARELGIEKYFVNIIGIDNDSYKKPDPRLILPLIEAGGVPEGRIVVIGDGRNDILLARNAGVLSCALLNGLGSREELLELKPDYACETIEELKTLFY